jgi:hypothetical protein
MNDQSQSGNEQQRQDNLSKTGLIKPPIEPQPSPGSDQKCRQSDEEQLDGTPGDHTRAPEPQPGGGFNWNDICWSQVCRNRRRLALGSATSDRIGLLAIITAR